MGGYSSSDSLDFYDLEGSDLDSATRQFFRVAIGETGKYFIQIDGKKYSIADISVNGVSFFTDSGKQFPIGTTVAGCELDLGKEAIYSLNGKIVHNSSEVVNSDLDIEKKWLCGLIWDDIGSKKEKMITSAFETLRKDVFAKSDMDE